MLGDGGGQTGRRAQQKSAFPLATWALPSTMAPCPGGVFGILHFGSRYEHIQLPSTRNTHHPQTPPPGHHPQTPPQTPSHPHLHPHTSSFPTRHSRAPGLPYEERSTMSGLSPRLGIGWMHGDAQPAKVAGLAHQPLLPAVVQSPRAALKEDVTGVGLGGKGGGGKGSFTGISYFWLVNV